VTALKTATLQRYRNNKKRRGRSEKRKSIQRKTVRRKANKHNSKTGEYPVATTSNVFRGNRLQDAWNKKEGLKLETEKKIVPLRSNSLKRSWPGSSGQPRRRLGKSVPETVEIDSVVVQWGGFLKRKIEII